MVEKRLDDGVRIAQLLASELTGGATRSAITVIDADPDVEPTPDGALAYRVVLTTRETNDENHETTGDSAVPEDTEVIATVNVHPDRAHVAFSARSDDTGSDSAVPDATASDSGVPDIAASAAEDAGLRVRPKAVQPPQTLVFVEDGAEVKRVLSVFEAVADALLAE
jgi:hypothetical protein